MTDYTMYRVNQAFEKSETLLKQRTEFWESNLRQRYLLLFKEIHDRQGAYGISTIIHKILPQLLLLPRKVKTIIMITLRIHQLIELCSNYQK